MKKRIILILIILLCFPFSIVNAFKIIDIKPDDSFVQEYGRDIKADTAYLQSIAESYSNKYIVTEEEYIDCELIDNFYSDLFQSLSLDELDNGKANFTTDNIYMANEYRGMLKQCKALGGLSGYSAEFEPTAFFRIHRNIALVGGYVKYSKTYQNPDDAYWQYVCRVEAMTKEIVPYETRQKLLDKVRGVNSFIDNDRTFKIFLVVNGKIDGLYLRD